MLDLGHFTVSSETVAQVVSCNFVNFFWLGAAEFFCHGHNVFMKSLLFKQVLTFNKLTWKKKTLVFAK